MLSSAYVRCIQTVEPLARRMGVPVEETGALAEGASVAEAVALVREAATLRGPDAVTGLRGPNAVVGVGVLCSHGDVIPMVLESLARTDGIHLPDDYPCAKGSTWVLESDGSGRVVEATYLPPPV